MILRVGNGFVTAEIVTTPTEHALGLSKHAELAPDEGMLFVFPHVRNATFWMSDVRFPIDIIGINKDSRVTKIIEGALPGSTERWTFSRVAAVLEVPGGFARRAGLRSGDLIEDVTGFDVVAGLMEIEDASEPIEDHPAHLTTPAVHPSDEPKEEYFKNLWGPDVGEQAVEGPILRLNAQIVDEAKFVERAAQVLLGHLDQMQWTPTVLDGGATERTVVTRRELARWLSGDQAGYGKAGSNASKYILDAASDEHGLNLIGDAFILAEQADTAQVGYANRQPILVLYRASQQNKTPLVTD